MHGRTTSRDRGPITTLAVAALMALLASSCLYLPSAQRTIDGSGATEVPWWCEGSPPLDDAACLLLSAQIDLALTEAQRYPTVADALAAGATAMPDLRADLGTAYQLPGTTDDFDPAAPQLLIYSGAEDGDRLAGVAHLVEGGGGIRPDGYPGDRDRWTWGDDDRWILPMWIVPGYQFQPNVFATRHPCLQAGVELTTTDDFCFRQAYTDGIDILVVNDDGIDAPGLAMLAAAIDDLYDVRAHVVAPSTDRSDDAAASPAGAAATPAQTATGFPATAVDGTAVDAVRYAIDELSLSPELVVAGLDDRPNVGPVVDTSGVVAAARAAAEAGLPAMVAGGGGDDGVAAALVWIEQFRLGLAGPQFSEVTAISAPDCADGTGPRGTVDAFVAYDDAGRAPTPADCASTHDILNDDVDAVRFGYVAVTDVGIDEPVRFAGTTDIVVAADGCEVVGNECALPFPSNALTVPDATTVTGRRVELPSATMPANSGGTPLDTDRHNRNDGFSPGSAALFLLPGLDPEASKLPPVTDLAASLADDSGSVVIDATTGERWAHWAELDANASDPTRQGTFIRPAVNYDNGHRIVIGLRGLVDDAGAPIEPTDAFVAYRDRLETDDPLVEARRPAMEQVFADLAAAGVPRHDLVMAWDFTVISEQSLTDPLFAMTADALAQQGATAPAYSISDVTDDPARNRRVINGTYEIPLYLTGDGGPGNGLNLVSDSDIPVRNGTWTAPFRCQLPLTVTPTDAGPGVVYGHGLLGTGRQATSSGPTALSQRNFVVCGTDLIGMAEEDVPNAIASLNDAGNFFTLAERLMQGHVNEVFLGRLLAHPDGFAADPDFIVDGRGALDVSRTYFYGISQGGIMGPATTAISPDIDRGVYGTFQLVFDPAYPDKLDQALVILANQMLWDRGEGNGYAALFDDPRDDMAPKRGLLHLALADHQVSNVAADVMARTMGASVVWPAVAPGRSSDVEPFWDIPRIDAYPFEGSATVMWDSGAPLGPLTNTSDFTGEDPHGDPRTEPAAVDQIAHFLLTGEVIDTCGGAPCTATPK